MFKSLNLSSFFKKASSDSNISQSDKDFTKLPTNIPDEVQIQNKIPTIKQICNDINTLLNQIAPKNNL